MLSLAFAGAPASNIAPPRRGLELVNSSLESTLRSSIHTIATIRKNNFEEIFVRIVKQPGAVLVDVRVHRRTKASRGEPQHTENGFCIPRTQTRELCEALEAAEREASE